MSPFCWLNDVRFTTDGSCFSSQTCRVLILLKNEFVVLSRVTQEAKLHSEQSYLIAEVACTCTKSEAPFGVIRKWSDAWDGGVFLALARLDLFPIVVGLVLAPTKCLLYCVLLPGICPRRVFVLILPFPPSSPHGGDPLETEASPECIRDHPLTCPHRLSGFLC